MEDRRKGPLHLVASVGPLGMRPRGSHYQQKVEEILEPIREGTHHRPTYAYEGRTLACWCKSQTRWGIGGHPCLTPIVFLIKSNIPCVAWRRPRTNSYKCMMVVRRV